MPQPLKKAVTAYFACSPVTDPVKLHIDERGVATITLDRPDRHNAFDSAMIASLSRQLNAIANDQSSRVVVLTGAGKSFSAGADIDHMRKLADASLDDNRDDAASLAALMVRLDAFPRPTIARINGAAIGGGVGLVACCDIAVASKRAKFGLSEVRLGLAPAVISPYVIAAMGARAARRYFQTGERFSAKRALRLGFIHEAVSQDKLDTTVAEIVDALLAGAPKAQRLNKQLIRDVTRAAWPADADTVSRTVELIARLRSAPEGREGLSAFLEKRRPRWP
jgi:methylglutaconyl-CoA hydratase